MDPKNVIERVFNDNNRYVRILSTAAIIVTSFIAIAGGYAFYMSNIWKPTVNVLEIDFDNAVCHLMINGKEKTLYGNSTLAAGGEWGVRFGTTGAAMDAGYNTIELVKNELVYQIYQIN